MNNKNRFIKRVDEYTCHRNVILKLTFPTVVFVRWTVHLLNFVVNPNQGCQPLTLQILRNGRRRHNAQPMTSFRQKTREKDVVGIVTFDLIGLLVPNHVIAYISKAYRSL